MSRVIGYNICIVVFLLIQNCITLSHLRVGGVKFTHTKPAS